MQLLMPFNKGMDVALERMFCLTKPDDDANQKRAQLRDAFSS